MAFRPDALASEIRRGQISPVPASLTPYEVVSPSMTRLAACATPAVPTSRAGTARALTAARRACRRLPARGLVLMDLLRRLGRLPGGRPLALRARLATRSPLSGRG